MAYKSDTDNRDLPNRVDLTVFDGEIGYDYHLSYQTTKSVEEAEQSIQGIDTEYSVHEDGRFPTTVEFFYDEEHEEDIHRLVQEL